MMKMLEGKSAIVTGAGRGIGAGIARRFAELGCNVTINYNKSKQQAEELLQEISRHAKCIAVQGDVSKAGGVEKVVSGHMQNFGKIDILVNNAGILYPRTITELTEEEWTETMETNIKSMFLMCKAVAPHMTSQKSGKIINISSVAGVMGGVVGPHYAASKGAVIAFTKNLARQLAQYKINVNAIASGPVNTDMMKDLSKEALEAIIKATPLGRIGEPLDIANAAVFLASDMSDWVTGQVLIVDGGRVM